MIHNNFNINNFFNEIYNKKIYLTHLKRQSVLLKKIKRKSHKSLYVKLFNDKLNYSFLNKNNEKNNNFCITYTIEIKFSTSNTFLNVKEASSGKLLFFTSAGCLDLNGKKKSARGPVLNAIYSIILKKLKYLKNAALALHLKNTSSFTLRIIQKLKSHFFIKTVNIFTLFPYNGCRKKKRKKMKIRSKKIRHILN